MEPVEVAKSMPEEVEKEPPVEEAGPSIPAPPDQSVCHRVRFPERVKYTVKAFGATAPQ